MATFNGTFTPNTSGNITIVGLPIIPEMVKMTASGRTGVDDNDQTRFATGVASEYSCSAHAVLKNSHYNHGVTREYHNDQKRCMVVLATPGGLLTRVVEIRHVSFGIDEDGYGSWTFNVVNASSDYRISVEFFGKELPEES